MLNLVELREIAGQAYEVHHKHLDDLGAGYDAPAWKDVDKATRNAWVLAVVETIDRSDKRRYQRGGRRRLIPKDRPAAEI